MIKASLVSSNILDLFDERFANTFGAIRNWGRCSDTVAVILPKILHGILGTLQNIL